MTIIIIGYLCCLLFFWFVWMIYMLWSCVTHHQKEAKRIKAKENKITIEEAWEEIMQEDTLDILKRRNNNVL